MIEFTIKTLESINHQFSLEDETTVAQLKEHIREEMGIDIDLQRLIFCGRVLTDDRRLSEIDVNGKVIHLVPRPPPSPESRNPTNNLSFHSPGQEMREAFDDAQRVIDRMSHPRNRQAPMRQLWALDPPSELVQDQHQSLMMTPTANRMEFIRRTLDDIRNSLSALSTHMGNDASGGSARPPAEPMETESSPPTETPPTTAAPPAEAPPSEGAPCAAPPPEAPPSEGPRSNGLPSAPLYEGSQSAPPPAEAPPAEAPPTETPTRRQTERDQFYDAAGGANAAAAPPRRRPRPPCATLTRPRDLAQLIEELEQLHEEFAPFRENILYILRDTSTTQVSQDERLHRQSFVELVCDVMHSFAHAYHALSDINVTVGDRCPRLTSGFSANRHPIPVQAHINVVHTTRRPTEAGTAAAAGAGAAAAASTEGATAAPGTPPTGIRFQGQTPLVAAFRAQRANMAAGGTQANPSATEAAAGAPPGPTAGANAPNPFHNPGRSTSQAVHNYPEPVTYQVEIETQVPIALPIDTALLNGLAAVATNLQQVQNMQNQQNQGAQQGQGQEQSQGEAQAQNPSQAQSQEQAARPRVLMDIENLLRTFSQAHPGVEVVMSMEQIHQLDSPPGGSPTSTHSPPVMEGNGVTLHPDTGFTTSGIVIGSAPGAAAGAPGSGPFPGGISFRASSFDNDNPHEFSIGPDGNPTFGVGVSGYGPASFTLQPEGGVYLGSMDANNAGITGDFLQNMFTSMFRQPMSTQGPTATTASTTTSTAAGTTASSTASTAGTTTTSNTSGNAASGTRVHRTPRGYNPFGNAEGRTSDSTWGLGPGEAYPNVLHLENVSMSPEPGQERLGPLSAMARARTLQQALQRRRDAERASNASAPNATRQGERSGHVERARQHNNNTRAHHVAMASMVYDRFLACDSLHARRRLSERRAAYQELYNERQRQRASLLPAPDIDTLQERNIHFTTRHMAIMMRLLSGPVSVEGRMNAFMVTVARVLFLEPNGRPRTYDPLRLPREFLFVRMQMREYLQRMLETVIDNGSERSPFEAVANLILRQNRAFLRRMNDYTPIDPLADPLALLRYWLRTRIPAIIACVMSDEATDAFVRHFYAVITRFFTDLCALFSQFCSHGFGGLRILYTAFIDHVTENYESTAREWIRLIARENLLAIQPTIDPNYYNPQNIECSERSRIRTTLPLTTPPLLPPPRNDTPDTLESLPSMSIPTMSSSSEASESPQPPEQDHPEDASDELDEDDNENSGADTVSTTSHNTVPRSPVLTRSAATSPRHDTPISTPQNEPSEAYEQETQNVSSEQDQAAALSPSRDSTQTSSSRRSPDSMRLVNVVPPKIIVEDWGEKLLPVFTRDRRDQRDRLRVPEPYSDAYLSGMPSRKRRCLRAARPPTTLDGFMNETVRESTVGSSDRPTPLDPTNLRTALRESVRTLVRNRAMSSEDFDPVRYSAAARLIEDKENKNESDKKKEIERKTEKLD